jgi:S-adenosylhomocysteine hydrolase
VNAGTLDAFTCEGRDLRRKIIAHEIELVFAIFFGGMNRALCRRQSEDEPTMTGVNRLKAQDVTEEGSIRLCIFAVNDEMGSKNHRFLPRSIWDQGYPVIQQLDHQR